MKCLKNMINRTLSERPPLATKAGKQVWRKFLFGNQSIDPGIEHLIRQALDRLIKGRTAFIITHRLPIIKNADLILVLDKGKVVEQGRHDELIVAEGLYKEIYESQISAAHILDSETEEDL